MLKTDFTNILGGRVTHRCKHVGLSISHWLPCPLVFWVFALDDLLNFVTTCTHEMFLSFLAKLIIVKQTLGAFRLERKRTPGLQDALAPIFRK